MESVVDISVNETPDHENIPVVAYTNDEKTVVGVAKFTGDNYTITFNDTALAQGIKDKIAGSSTSFGISSQK